MADREKVIKALECCFVDKCKKCPYVDGPYCKAIPKDGKANIEVPTGLANDALELLKEYVYGTRYVPVVRCYECQYWEPENAEEGDHSGHCRKPYGMSENAVTDGTWFCSDGERDPDA